MSYCAKIPEENQGGGAAALSGHQPDPEGLLVYPVDFGVGAAGGDGRSAVLYPLVRRCKVPRLQMARDMYRAQRRVDTLRNYLEEAESVQAGVWALLCVLSRWLNRYEAELPEGVMAAWAGVCGGRRGCAQNSPFSPGLSWSILGERGKTAMLDFRMDTFLAVCRHRNYTRRRRS